ncbi:hypothetical protein [Streptomyces sp. NPDC051014]|uniref:hypothetical protein n=1 Tax=Streptomyces sp. NPDC051014 TaxID=3155751 RepID=UPI003402E1B7
MEFLRVAASGEWRLALEVALAEGLSPEWEEETLRDFVRVLAPAYDADAETIAGMLHQWADSLTMERCLSVSSQWLWLALRARDDRVNAVAIARLSLQWPECTMDKLDYVLCRIADRGDEDGRAAAADIYQQGLFGTYTPEQLEADLGHLRVSAQHRHEIVRQAGPAQQHSVETDPRQRRIVRQADPSVEQYVAAERLQQPSTERHAVEEHRERRPRAVDKAARDRKRMAQKVIDSVGALNREAVVEGLKPARQGGSGSPASRRDKSDADHERVTGAYVDHMNRSKADLRAAGQAPGGAEGVRAGGSTAAERRVRDGGLHGDAIRQWRRKAEAVDGESEQILKKTAAGGTVYFGFHPGTKFALIGKENSHYEEWKDQFTGENVDMLVEGTITVTKRGWKGKARVDLNGAHDLQLVASIVKRYTDKELTIGSSRPTGPFIRR